jgi:hypothetical protein
MMTARWATMGSHTLWSVRPKPAFPRKPFWTPHGSNLLMSLYRGNYSTRKRTPSASSGVKRQPELHFVAWCPYTAANGSCIVGSPGSGPSPMASTEPRRGPQSLPQLRGTLQGDGSMPAQGVPALL